MENERMNHFKWFFRSFIWLFIVMLAIDIITKQIIIQNGTPGSEIADWGFVRINYVLNYNAAFGLGADNTEKGHLISRVVYLIIASLATIGITSYLILKRKDMKLFVRASLILIVTGAVGNMIDRIFYAPYHAVVDWIDFYWFWGFNFNIADSCIVVAAFMLVIYIIVGEVKEAIKKRKEESLDVKTLSKTEQERLEQENKDKEN